MRSKPCIPEIRGRYDSLTAAEKRIADQILQNPSEAVGLSAAALAARAETASSAVVRFCHSLEFEGYADFKMHLAVELSQTEPLGFLPGISIHDSSGEILDKVFAANMQSLKDTAKRLDRAAFEEVVQRIAVAETVYVYGVGTSASLAGDLQYRLMTLGYNAMVFSDVVQMFVSTLNIKERAVAIGISHSGRTQCILDALTLAKGQGAETVCITSYMASPITRICDHTLAVYSAETQYPVEAVAARTAQMSVIDALAAALSVRGKEDPAVRSKVIHEVVNSVRCRGGKR